MGRVRSFIGVGVGDEVRRRAVALQQQLARTGAGVKWARTLFSVSLLYLMVLLGGVVVGQAMNGGDPVHLSAGTAR